MTGLLLALAVSCTPLETFRLELSPDIATVARASWTLGVDAPSRVVWGVLPDCERWASRWLDGSGPHVLDLLGGAGGEALCARVEVDLGGTVRREPPRSLLLGEPPEVLPVIEVEDLGADDTRWFLGSTGSTPATILLFDQRGEVLWYRGPKEDRASPCSQALGPQAGLAWLDEPASPGTDDAFLEHRTWGGEPVEERELPGAHHAFEVLPDGTTGWLGLEVREVDPYGPVAGDVIMERDPGGEERVVWSAFDTFPVEPDPNWRSSYYPDALDWTHGDFLYWDPGRDTWTISMRNIDTVAEIDRATGELLRSTGRWATHELVDAEKLPDPLVRYPHGARWIRDDHLLLFTSPAEVEESWALELAFDDAAGTVRPTWWWGEGRGVKAVALGQALELAGGDRLVNFGSAGLVERVDADGEVTWRLRMLQGAYPAYLSEVTDLLGSPP